ncbi:CerR family C-terminal domain-containing protein [uncultured Tolumonas sp.]|uniref:CerR family C-terminal domain-containing protein n=1 Tax=uncultured Tolumonas sp. TaxID=263765 RepID=UPI00292D572B|nr:CerR family C-terminal domain-containing protein [uncultured Tolumonas sp.]
METIPLTDPRSEATRQRLIDTGLTLFGRYGFDGVTTRQLATTAQVNQAAIPYHFGGKEGVYLAIAEQIAASVGPQVNALQKNIHSRLNHEAPQNLLLECTIKLAEIAFTPEHQSSWFIFLTREQFHPTAALTILQRGFIDPVHQLIGELIALITNTTVDTEANILLTQAYLGPLVGFVCGKALLNKRLNWPIELTDLEWRQVIATVAHCSRATITGLMLNAE